MEIKFINNIKKYVLYFVNINIIIKMKSLKGYFNLKNSRSNLLKNKIIKLNHKIIIPKKESMYDKINNHFKSYDFAKLQLLGEDNKNFGDFNYHGIIYKPKNIKVEYLGHKNFSSDLIVDKSLIQNKSLSLKKNSISFINPIYNMKEKEKNVNQFKDNSFFGDIYLPKISKINNSNNKNINKNIIKNYSEINYNKDRKNEKYLEKNKDLNKLNKIGNNSEYKRLENNRNNKKRESKKNYSYNSQSYSNITKECILKKLKVLNLKKRLKKKMELLENQVNNSSKFITNGSKINEEEKPQFKLRFNNLSNNFKQYMN